MGLGNLLLRDEGIGIHAIRALEARYLTPPGLEIVDGATAGLDLLPYIEGRDRVLFVDAVISGRSPATSASWKTRRFRPCSPTKIPCIIWPGRLAGRGPTPRRRPRESASSVSSPTSSKPAWSSQNSFKKNCPSCCLASSPNYRIGASRSLRFP